MRAIAGLVAAGSLAASLVVAAQDGATPATSQVAGYERLRVAAGDAPEAGAVLLSELNCLSCHVAPAAVAASVDTKPAPDLRKYRWSGDVPLDPRLPARSAVRQAGHHDASVARGRRRARTSRGGERSGELPCWSSRTSTRRCPTRRSASRTAVERGRELFHNVGCVACHTPEGESPGFADVSLPELSAKAYVPTLAEFLIGPECSALRQPHARPPSGAHRGRGPGGLSAARPGAGASGLSARVRVRVLHAPGRRKRGSNSTHRSTSTSSALTVWELSSV